MVDLKRIIKNCREKGIEKFDNDASLTNTDEGKKMVQFLTKNIDCRKISDWGRDEDTDLFIGLDESQWIKYIQVNENGAGPFRIKSEKIEKMTDDDVYSFLTGDECTDREFLMFMSEGYHLLPF